MLVQDMISLLVKKNYTVYSLVPVKKLNVDYWHGWAEDVLWIQEEKVSVSDLKLWHSDIVQEELVFPAKESTIHDKDKQMHIFTE